MDSLLETLPNEWKTWGLLITVGFPVAIIILGELLLYLEKRDSEFIPIVKNIRNILLPSLAAYLILTKIIKLDANSIPLKIVATLFWLTLIHFTLKFLNTLIFSTALPSEVRNKIPKLLVDFTRTFLVLLGAAIIASNVWGADLGKLLAALGVGSVVLGLALQDVLGGLFSGLALLSSKPFSVGDWIRVGDIDGEVVSIDWRAVTLKNFDNDTVVIPNAVIAKERFKNYSRPTPIHRESVGFDISFDDPPNRVKEVLLKATNSTEGILKEPSAEVALISYDEFSIHYEVRYFINDYSKVAAIRNNFITKIWYANKREGITFPTKALEVYNYDGEVKKDIDIVESIATLLNDSKIFTIAFEELKELAKECKIKDFGVGESLLQKDIFTNYVYLIIKGIAKEYIKKDGKIVYESKLKRGDLFGLASLVRKEPSLVTVSAVTDIEVIEIEIEAMQELLKKHPKTALSLEKLAQEHKKKISKRLFLNA